MENIELAWIFHEIADLMELKNENRFKTQAYRKAARIIENLPQNIKELAQTNSLRDIPGIGRNLEEKINEYIANGRIEFLEELRRQVPPGLLEVLAVPGVGVRMAKTFYEQLGVTSLEQLEEAARQRKIRELRGMGGKTEMSILRSINRLKARSGLISVGTALPIAEEIKASLNQLDFVQRLDIAGELRRFCEVVTKIVFVAVTERPEELKRLFAHMPLTADVLDETATRVAVKLKSGIPAELYLTSAENFGSALHYLTGSPAYLESMDKTARRVGLCLDRLVLKKEHGEVVPVPEEKALFELLGLDFIQPNLRENRGEIEKARQGTLPRLISLSDISGDLHMHTTYSDGVASVEVMAKDAMDRGLQYIAICDHSRSLRIANGLSIEELRSQGEEIRRISEELDFPILRGVECDILPDGSLDYPDEILAEMDVVIGSVHSHFKQDEKTMTERILKAIGNPHIDIIAHLTGRMIGYRDGYQVDIDRIFEAAVSNNKILEINAAPERLDLSDELAFRARECGIKIAINTDAHTTDQLGYMRYGVEYGRRAWLEPEDVINTWEMTHLLGFLRRNG